LLGDGQALLIAGYAQENDSNDQSGVPGLSTVPVVGGLFKYTEKRKTRVERFFLLTPKVVVL
jgi:type III secretion protein C